MLAEVLVYIGVVFVVLGLAFAAFYRCVDNSVVMRRNAEDIARVLHVGERWRADVRAASQVRVEDLPEGRFLYLSGDHESVVYRFATNTCSRRLGQRGWVCILPNVQSSQVQPDPRGQVTAWRWELELRPYSKAGIKPGGTRPLFTFLAVPQSSSKLAAVKPSAL
jgi:hypothetical protein